MPPTSPMTPEPTQPEWTSATLSLALLSGTAEVRVRVPAGPCRLLDILPAVHGLTDLIVADAARACQAKGLTVSCHKGCAYCCHILAFVADVEAHHLRRVVAGMPPSRRAQVMERFWNARGVLDRHGLLERLCGDLDRPALRQLMLDYERLRLSCPFLQEDACSIYPDRPAICREVLVVSPAETCLSGNERNINCVPLAARMSLALLGVAAAGANTGDHTVPLIVGPEWSATHPDDSPLRPGIDLLKDLLECLKRSSDRSAGSEA